MTIQRAIIEVLGNVHPFTLPQTTIFADVRNKGVPVTLSELRAELDTLEAKRQIVGVSDEDKGPCYKLTAEGKARLLG